MTDAFDPGLTRRMMTAGISPEETARALDRINRPGAGSRSRAVESIPVIDGEEILDLRSLSVWEGDERQLLGQAESVGIDMSLMREASASGGRLYFTHSLLRRIGESLYPAVSYGVLNGGSATSYSDSTRNSLFDETFYEIYEPLLASIEPTVAGKPKGVTAAVYDANGLAGPSFIELKLRALLLGALEHQRIRGPSPLALAPMFQMTSVGNDREVRESLDRYAGSPLIAYFAERAGIDITRVRTEVQPLIAAFTHSRERSPRRVFERARGNAGELLPLPGGHGQCFTVLRPVFEELRSLGKELIVLSNVDNLGSTVDPVELAIVALSGRPAAFEFSVKTPIDIKGGILARDNGGRLTSADIGPAISPEEIDRMERAGHEILFNCATGIFRLPSLLDSLDRIEAELPIRLSDQQKDAGSYAQAEQIAWEVIGILENPLIFAVRKSWRFLASKLLMESLMTSGIGLDDPRLLRGSAETRNRRRVAYELHEGLVRRLIGSYGMRYTRAGWVPHP